MSFDLIEYARQHRYRTRNIQDGHPCPPALYERHQGDRVHDANQGAEDRCDAIVGYRGYVFVESGRLEVYIGPYKNSQGVTMTIPQFEGIGGMVTQEGDFEFGGYAPLGRIDAVCELIRAARRPTGSAAHLEKHRFRHGTPANGPTIDATDQGGR